MQTPAGPAIDKMPINDLVDVIRRNLHGNPAKSALYRIYEILHGEFPEYRCQANFSLGDLEAQLHEGIRENSPVVVAFLEKETKIPALWKWRIHFAEIAGAGATISDMLSSIKSPEIGTQRSHIA